VETIASAPFLSNPQTTHIFTDPDEWALALQQLLSLRIIDATSTRTEAFRTINTIVQVGELQILSVNAPTPFQVERYEHDFATLYMPYRAATRWHDAEQTLTIQRNEGVLYFAPGTLISVENIDSAGVVTFINRSSLLSRAINISQGGINLAAVHKHLNRSQKLCSDTTVTRHLIQGLYSCFTLLDSIHQAGEQLISRTAVDDAFLRILRMLLFPELRALQSQQLVHKPKLLRMKELEEWIVANVGQKLSMSDLEIQCNYSSRSIQGYFHEHYGMSPKQWIIQQRMQHALTLLTSGKELNVGEAARQCGYHDASRFSRHFVKQFGFLPKDCKKTQLLNRS